ncbi:hypothetical protein MMC30_001985 [Trapelia coarctata]|nr:hypothetical protein [Trapelia coarctata]
METPIKDGGSTPKRHSRHVSYNRASLTRKSTKGPLEIDDPLSELRPPTSAKDATEATKTALPFSPAIPSTFFPSASLTALEDPVKDFSYLLRPEIYHSLPQADVPTPFRTSHNAPTPETTLPALLSSGHFRPAASLAAALLTGSPSPTAPADIFSLLYVRLACLTLINATSFAAQEVKALEDLSSPFYRHSVRNVHLVPWELRVLAVRLQGIGYGDTRRGVMGYYDLAKDARSELGKAKIQEEKKLWKGRLRDLGVRVASSLVEMGDLAAAGRHLNSLLSTAKGIGDDRLLRGRLGLLYLKIGNLTAAKEYIDPHAETSAEHPYSTTISPLLSMAQGDYSSAVTQLIAIKERSASPDPLVLQNLAVCLIYTGRLVEARPLLESLVSEGHSFPSLIFNLSTIYELCTEKSRGLKMDLIGKLADREGTSIGWESLNADLKL